MKEDKNLLKSAYQKMKIGMNDFKKIQNLLLREENKENI